MKKKALITGISGQDGAYLSKLLIEKDYEVLGITRINNNFNNFGLSYLGIQNLVAVEELDILDQSKLINLINKFEPTEIYHLASQSSVSNSELMPNQTIVFNITSTLNLLEAIRNNNKNIKLLNASSSEIFGQNTTLPIIESNSFNPQNIYAISKCTSHRLVDYYRINYNTFSSNAILFNHESYLRKENFFIKKIIRGAINLKLKKINFLEIGDLSIKRDFGYAPEYVYAMWLIIQSSLSKNYIVSSGKSYSLESIVNFVFDKLKISKDLIKRSENLIRKNEIKDIYGDNSKIKNELNWKPTTNFFEILEKLIAEELLTKQK